MYENAITYAAPKPLMDEYIYLGGSRNGGHWYFGKSGDNSITALALNFDENEKVNSGKLTLRYSENYELSCQER